jgi:Asp-tRNA(Asn)/Glu-tRNA(Gln) amidotransferase A subunit family amidase
MDFAEYRTYDAMGLAELIRDGGVSPLEAFYASLEGVERLDPTLNAFVEVWADRTLQDVRTTEVSGPLAGVPFALKDMVEWEGAKMTLGSKLLDGFVAEQSHPLVERYLDAGLSFVGRTNMSELGLLPLTEPNAWGITRNPWNHERSPGGSSGGSAAAVAAGIVPVAHAADGGGSIRIPASCCGLFGLKPSRGRTVESITEVPDGFVVHHCVAKSVRDSALLLDLTAGESPGSRWRHPGDEGGFLEAVEQPPEELCIGVMFGDFRGRSLHDDCRQAVEHTAALCEDLGHHVEEARPDFDGQAFLHAFSDLWSVGASFFFRMVQKELDQLGLPGPLVKVLKKRGVLQMLTRLANRVGFPVVEPFTMRLAEHAEKMAPADLWMSWHVLNEATASMSRFFERYDLLLTSTLAEPPWPHDHYDLSGDTIPEIEERLFSYAGLTPLANTSGLPAMSVPLHVADGLPIGTQFVAPHACERLLIRLAGQLERAQPWLGKLHDIGS